MEEIRCSAGVGFLHSQPVHPFPSREKASVCTQTKEVSGGERESLDEVNLQVFCPEIETKASK